MEQTCNRCHEPLRDEFRYCPACGLPQLVYSAENTGDTPGQPDRWDQVIRDANVVNWRSAARSILPLAIAAGVFCPALASKAGLIGFLLMSAAAAWAVALYARSQRPAWITTRAGARIGLVTGIIASWTAAASSGLSLFAMRFWMHQGSVFDKFWQDAVSQKMVQQWESIGTDAQKIAMFKAILLSPQGRAGFVLFAVAMLMTMLMVFAIAGGAVGASRFARAKRS
jgi:hypothetical protein